MKDCTHQEIYELGDQVADDEDDGRVHVNVCHICGQRRRHSLSIVACLLSRGVLVIGRTGLHHDPVYKDNPQHELRLQSCPPEINKLGRTITRWRPRKTHGHYMYGGVCYRIAMHELGHVFGLGDTTSAILGNYGLWPTVMSGSMYDNCEPTALDVAAIKAIYQSR